MYLNQDLTFDVYFSIIKRKLFFVLSVTSFITIISLFFILFLPSVYESSSTILIEGKKVDVDNSRRENNLAARFESLNAMLFTNEKMLAIAKKYDLFDSNDSKVMTSQDEARVADLVRSNIFTQIIKSEEGSRWTERQVLAFKVVSNFKKPDITYNITTDIVNAILNEESKRKKEKAVTVASFFDHDAEEKKIKLEEVEQEIIAYKRSHANSLPANREALIATLESLREQYNLTQKEIGLARSELAKLKVELSSAKAGVSTLNLKQNTNNQDDGLELYRSQLTQALTIYSENHPKVKSLRSKIKALEKYELADKEEQETVKDFEVAKVQVLIDAVKDRIKLAESEKSQFANRIKNTESMLMQTAQTEGILDTLDRKYETAKVAYERAKSKQDKARIEKEIQLQDKGETFIIIEPPVLPTVPVKPNRKLLFIGAIVAAVSLSVILAFLMEFSDRRLRGSMSIAQAIKLQPLAVIPYIKTKADETVFKKNVCKLAVFNLSVFILCVTVIHHFISPVEDVIKRLVGLVVSV